MFSKDEIEILKDKEFTLKIKVTASGQINVLVESLPGSENPLIGEDCQKLENYLVRKFGVSLKVIPTHELYLKYKKTQETEKEAPAPETPEKPKGKQKPPGKIQGFQKKRKR